ncbi:hypothetical protein [Leifsonia poae]|uniref:Signal transduction histidine kinase n=1 Tax=Leifsonia poae TaxID=110933 RepID=A0A9W6H9E7_9MICO|nr:hypothetical protein [Leifsonia poae]GLJ75918.1 hypothetical protein GCM10017584_14920 [Leifsonia poae]
MIPPSARRMLARATGPSAVTVWTWLVSAPFALTAMSGSQYVAAGSPSGAIWGLAALEHVGVGILLLACRLLLRPVRGGFRPTAVLLVFAVVGAARPYLFLGSAALLGIDVTVGDMASRVAVNIVVCVVSFALIAICVDLVHEHFRVLGRLRAVQRAADADSETGRRRIEELRENVVDAVLARIDETVRPAIRPGLAPGEASRLLRSIANDIVRPVSHDLFDSEPDEPVATAPELAEPRMRDWLLASVTELRPAPPVFTSLLFVALFVPYAVGAYGIPLTVVQGVIAAALLYAGNVVVGWAARHAAGPAATVVVIGGYFAVGVVVAAESTALVDLSGFRTDLVWMQALLFPVIACAIALVVSLAASLGDDERRLEESLQSSVAVAARVRAAYDHERTGLATLLHSGVQADLIATALAIAGDDDADAEGAVRDALDRIRAELEGAPVETRDGRGPRVQVGRLVDSWSSAMPLAAEIDEAVWDRLHDPVRRQVVVDAVSEGLANAVRHGDGSAVTLAVRASGRDGVTVVVTSGGQLRGGRPGIGLRDLSRHSEVILRQRLGAVELAVAVP